MRYFWYLNSHFLLLLDLLQYGHVMDVIPTVDVALLIWMKTLNLLSIMWYVHELGTMNAYRNVLIELELLLRSLIPWVSIFNIHWFASVTVSWITSRLLPILLLQFWYSWRRATPSNSRHWFVYWLLYSHEGLITAHYTSWSRIEYFSTRLWR